MKLITYRPPSDKPKGRSFKGLVKNMVKYIAFLLYPLVGYFLILLTKKNNNPKKYQVSLCGVFKNEGPYLKEWIDFHLVCGVDHFYLYNNNSDDNYREILQPYIDEGVVELIDWPDSYPQLAVYRHSYENFRNETQWIGYLDMDEFACPASETNLVHVLNRYKNYPSVLFCWKFFGTSGRLNPDPDMFVIEQYTSSWPHPVNVGKSFINTRFRFRPFTSPHYFYANALGGLFIPPVNQFKKFVLFWHHHRPIFRKDERMVINHYWSKSLNEFFYKYKIRGSVLNSTNGELQIKEYETRFQYHELMNTTKDYTIQRFLVALKKRYTNP